MTNEIEAALIAARDAFDKYAHHHLQKWFAIKDDPEQAKQAIEIWNKYRENVWLSEKMRLAIADAIAYQQHQAGLIEALNRLLSWESGGGSCAENVAFAQNVLLQIKKQEGNT